MSIVVTVKVDAQGQPGVAALRSNLEGLEKQGAKTQKSMGGLSDELTKMGKLAGATFAAAFGARELAAMADAYTSMSNRLRSVTRDQAGLSAAMEQTFAIAQRTRAGWEATSETFVRLTNSTKALGLAQAEVLSLTETIGKAVKLSGASSSEASASMLQLSQAFASGTLQGDEFRTLAEAMPSMLDLIAKQMGKPRGELKALASEGKITSEVLVRAFQGAKAGIDAGFAKTAPTLSDAWATFRNEITKVVGESKLIEKIMPLIAQATEGFVVTIRNLGDTLGPVMAVLGQLGPVIKVAAGAMKIFNEYINPLGLMKNIGGAAMDFFSREKLKPLPPIDPQINADYEKHQTKLEQIRRTMAEIGDQRPFVKSTVEAGELEKELAKIDSKRAMEKMGDAAARVYDKMHNVNGELEKIQQNLIDGPLHIKKLEDALTGLNKVINDKRAMLGGGAHASLGPTKEEERAAGDTASEIARLKLVAAVGPVAAKVKQDEMDFVTSLGQLQMALAAGDLTNEQYAKGLKNIGIEMSPLQKLLEQIRQPQMEYARDLAMLGELHRSGAINAGEYADQIDRIRESAGLSAVDRLGGGRAAAGIDELSMQKLSRDSGVTIPSAEGLVGGPGDLELREQNRQAIADANAMIEMDKKWALAMGDVEQKYAQTIDKQKQATANTVKFLSEIDKLRNARDITHGLEQGFNAVGNEITNVAKLVEDTMLQAFRKIEDALVAMVTGAKFELSSLMTMLQQALARLAIRQAISGAAEALDLKKKVVEDFVIIEDDPDPTERRAPSRGGGRGGGIRGALASDEGQEAVMNIVTKQNGSALATRDRLRSRS